MIPWRATALGSVAFIWLALSAENSAAFSFTPLSASLTPAGPGSSRSFQLQNDSPENIAIELSITSRQIDPQGKEANLKSPEIDKNFLVFPPQVVLKPNEKKTIRVSWVGHPTPGRELAYRLIAEQLPVAMDKRDAKKKGAVINILLKYVAALYITPEGASPKVVLKEAEPADTTQRQIRLVFENQGSAHQVLSGLRLRLTSGDGEKESSLVLAGEPLKGIEGQNLLPGASRHFTLDWPASLPKGPLKVDFEVQN